MELLISFEVHDNVDGYRLLNKEEAWISLSPKRPLNEIYPVMKRLARFLLTNHASQLQEKFPHLVKKSSKPSRRNRSRKRAASKRQSDFKRIGGLQ